MERSNAPWSREQIDSINAFQHSGDMHPFTCPHRSVAPHESFDVLVATLSGLACTRCTYRQTWVWDYMVMWDADLSQFPLPDGRILTTHPAWRCEGETCCIHNPSKHHMREWPLNWREDVTLMERTCPHGIGHPDPDSLAFRARVGQDASGVHGCDGCCRP